MVNSDDPGELDEHMLHMNMPRKDRIRFPICDNGAGNASSHCSTFKRRIRHRADASILPVSVVVLCMLSRRICILLSDCWLAL